MILCDDSVEPVVTAVAGEDVLTSEDHCTIVSVSIDEDNLLMWEIPGFLSGTGNEFEFEVCGRDLQFGENTISVIASDYCGNEGTESITITYNPDIP